MRSNKTGLGPWGIKNRRKRTKAIHVMQRVTDRKDRFMRNNNATVQLDAQLNKISKMSKVTTGKHGLMAAIMAAMGRSK